jgi:hypothetical protein
MIVDVKLELIETVQAVGSGIIQKLWTKQHEIIHKLCEASLAYPFLVTNMRHLDEVQCLRLVLVSYFKSSCRRHVQIQNTRKTDPHNYFLNIQKAS